MNSIKFGVVYFAVISAVTFAAYAKDKAAAMNNLWRVEERSLHLLALLGGWPAALAAQRLLSHKSRKARFQRVFIMTVALNCVVVAGILITF